MLQRTAVYDHFKDGDFIVVTDLNVPGALSVTNDAENVVKSVFDIYGDFRIIYHDSDGRVDELKHDKGVFTGFAPLSPY